MRTFFRIILAASFCASFGCGNGSPAMSHVDDDSFQSVDWYFNCPSDSDSDKWVHPPSDAEHLRFDDGGPTTGYYRRELFGSPVTVHGKLCPPPTVQRDIVFVIDVSGSMIESDPEVTDPTDSTKMTCGRLAALEALFAELDPNFVTFAVGTFDDTVENKSSKFFANKADLYADLEAQDTGGKKYYDIICNSNTGTNYDAGMQYASDAFSAARSTADLTVIFLSDGVPDTGEEGVTIATQLKSPGAVVGGVTKPVLIESVILGDEDPTAIQALATVDPVTGKPIFAKADTPADLAPIVAAMANNLTSAQLSHGGGGEVSTVINVFPSVDLQTYKFELPPFALQIDRTQPSYQIEIKYADQAGNVSTDAGTINWLDD